eukprot:COSAG02_NODE_30378_length_552_cov_0.905077_1_plen_48_part_10
MESRTHHTVLVLSIHVFESIRSAPCEYYWYMYREEYRRRSTTILGNES